MLQPSKKRRDFGNGDRMLYYFRSLCNWPFSESFFLLCSCQGALSANPEDDTEFDLRLRFFSDSVFERSLTFRFASLKLL